VRKRRTVDGIEGGRSVGGGVVVVVRVLRGRWSRRSSVSTAQLACYSQRVPRRSLSAAASSACVPIALVGSQVSRRASPRLLADHHRAETRRGDVSARQPLWKKCAWCLLLLGCVGVPAITATRSSAAETRGAEHTVHAHLLVGMFHASMYRKSGPNAMCYRHLHCPFAIYTNVRLQSRKSGLRTLQSLLYH
jgi:hypothetical protein